MEIYPDVLEADLLINVPIAKTHGNTRLTLGAKNLMGVIDSRSQIHRNMGQRLADLASVVKPDLTIVDAMRMLMANGPTGGNLDDVKAAGTLIASPDLVAADSYAARFFRKSSSELNGQRLDEIFPEVAASIEAGIDDAEVVYVRGENHPTIGFKRVALKRLDNTAAGHIITFVDISEIIKVRKEIRSKERLAAMGEVVARVAHEMRNPLFGITAAAQILAMELKFTAEQNELMTSLFNEAQRMNHMVEELLDCSKEMKLKKTTFDLIKSLNDALTFNECFMVEKNLSLQKITPDDELFVVADPERFRQVMVNILKNAVDATPHGGTITVTVGELDGTVSIQVGDTGTGIQGDIMEKIFDVFYTTKRRGTGLGLPICRKIVESHGGSLTVRNNDCSGATFTVTLPSGGIS